MDSMNGPKDFLLRFQANKKLERGKEEGSFILMQGRLISRLTTLLEVLDNKAPAKVLDSLIFGRIVIIMRGLIKETSETSNGQHIYLLLPILET